MKKKHIVLIPCGVLPVPAARGGAVENLVQQLADLNEEHAAYEMTVYSPYDSEAAELARTYKHARFCFVETAGWRNKACSALFRLRGGLRSMLSGYDFQNLFLHRIIKDMEAHRDADVVLLENAPRYAVGIHRHFPGAKVAQHYHNVPEEASAWRAIDACTDGYFCVSDFIRREVETLFRLTGPARAKAKVFYNCLDVDRFKDAGGQWRKRKRTELGMSEGDKVVIYTGRLQPYKGVKELLSGFSRLRRPDAKLLIVGGSFYGGGKGSRFIGELKRIAEALEGRVIFTGFVPYAAMPEYYAAADVAVVPSICDDAFALSALEALAAGLPVVATRSGGIPEVVDERCALLLERDGTLPGSIADSLSAILSDDGLRKGMSEAARRRAELFAAETYWDRFTKLIHDL